MNVSRADWVRDDSKNALSGVNLAGIRKFVQTAGAVVFGWHYFYYAGRARSDVIFGSADELINLVEQARDLETTSRCTTWTASGSWRSCT